MGRGRGVRIPESRSPNWYCCICTKLNFFLSQDRSQISFWQWLINQLWKTQTDQPDWQSITSINYSAVPLTLTSCWGKGPLEFSGTLIGGMTQSRFCRLSPWEFWWWRQGSRVSLGCCGRSADVFFFPLCWWGRKKVKQKNYEGIILCFFFAEFHLKNKTQTKERAHSVFCLQ